MGGHLNIYLFIFEFTLNRAHNYHQNPNAARGTTNAPESMGYAVANPQETIYQSEKTFTVQNT